MDIWGIIIFVACIAAVVAIIRLGMWAQRNPMLPDESYDDELEWQYDIK